MGTTLTVGLAGCSSDQTNAGNGNGNGNGNEDGNGNTDSSGGETEPSDDSDDTETSESEYAIEGDVPEELRVGEEYRYSVTISNEGDGTGDGEARFGLEATDRGSGSTDSLFEETIELEPGESESSESGTGSFDEPRTIEWRFWVEGPDNSDEDIHETVVELPDTEFGDTFQTPTNLELTAENPRLADRYEYENWSGETETKQAESGEQFAFIDLTVDNVGSETRESSNRLSFELIYDGALYEPLGVEYEREDRYGGLNDLPSGTGESGVLPFSVPDSADISDLELYHTDSDYEAGEEWEVRWS
ncbi:hypothetical protein CP557_01555 [Natrinema ejinorense]|uniref:DUF4352 domain-containing protein n=1 Tax=Natrinema ejinorense TaxID=373386 RepID=A0A2A5QR60_9EURY|nr:hypothetical protein CP557_01555 [Natrinema ejinorense]